MVIGGAGYIGAHVVRLLQEAKQQVVVVDDLSTGSPSRIGDATLVQMDVARAEHLPALTQAMRDNKVSAVIHFAARKQVGESVEKPAWYYAQNIGGLAHVLQAIETAGVGQMIFSSSAAVYGMPDVGVIDEDVTPRPINPYGETKMIGEWMMRDCERAWGLNWCALRYFNVAGSGWDDLGDPAIMNLIPMVFDRLDRGQAPKIFGTDYPTEDGTCVRDYVHVHDLARAHLDTLQYLNSATEPQRRFNVGTGQGYSVREVIDMVAKVTRIDFTAEVAPRRAGDPPHLICSPALIEKHLGFHAQLGLEEIVRSAWSAWRHDHEQQ